MKCPVCNTSDKLSVVALINCLLSFDKEGEIEGSEPTGDHEWDEHSHVTCAGCGFHGPALWFNPDKSGNTVFVARSNGDGFLCLEPEAMGVEGVISIDMSTLIDNNFEAFLDIICEKLADSSCLCEPDYKVIGSSKDEVKLLVYGYFSEVEQWQEFLAECVDGNATVTCKFCHKPALTATAHAHGRGSVGAECCWDERLRATA